MVTRLTFQDAKPSATSNRDDRVGAIAFGPAITKPTQPAPTPERTITPLQLTGQAPVTRQQPTTPSPLFGSGGSKMANECVNTFRQRYGNDYYNQHGNRVDMLLNQLVPVRAEVVATWGTKTLERSRMVSTEAAKLIAAYVAADVASTMGKVAEAMKPRSGFLGKLRSGNIEAYAPMLAAMQPSVQQWIEQSVLLVGKSKNAAAEVFLKSATLTAMHETVGDPPDNTLSQLLFNRRTLLQQGVMQAELTVKQVEDTYSQLLDLQMRLDQVLNVTIPAYTAAQLRK